MDPLSVTLAVISLLSTVKEIVELGRGIHESFAKTSDNFRNAKRVAEEIKEMVEEISTFCEDHKDTLDNMKEFYLAVEGLLGQFRRFATTILPLLPQTGGRRKDRIFRGWDAWRNNSKIEENILTLQRDIMKLIRRFMLKSALRTEIKLQTIHQDTTRGLEVLQAVRRDVSALREAAPGTTTHASYISSGRTSDGFNRNVLMFAQSTPSTSTPMLRTPDVITEEVMTTAFIKLQINNIAMAVENMPKLPVSALNNPAQDRVEKFQMSTNLSCASMSITLLRRHIVREVTIIRDILDIPTISAISLHDGARSLNELSAALGTLGMAQESILVGEWAIALARTLVDASGGKEPDLRANLAHYLLDQSRRYDDGADQCPQSELLVRGRDRCRSLQAIEEAYATTQDLRDQCLGEQFQILYSGILVQYAGLIDHERSIEMSVEAVRVLEKIFNVQAFTVSRFLGRIQIESVVQHSSLFIDKLFSLSPPIIAIAVYADALQKLGTCWFDVNAWQVRSYTISAESGPTKCGIDLQRLAMALRRKAVSICGHGSKASFASALLLLVQSRSASPTTVAEELLDIADECIELFRDLVDKNPPFYAQQLALVMWKKAEALERLSRDAEAIATLEELVHFTTQIVQDSALCTLALDNLSRQFRRHERHEDALRTVTLAITMYHEEAQIQAWRYSCLSSDLRQLRRFKESAEAAQTSVELYRHLAMSDPDTWMGQLTEGLAHLAHRLAASGDNSGSLAAWEESVHMLDNLLNTDPDTSSTFIDRYLATLRVHKVISYVLDDEEGSLKVGSTAVQYFLWLSEVYPQNTDTRQYFWVEYCYAYNMLRVGRVRDAQRYIDHLLDAWDSKFEALLGSSITNSSLRAAMMGLKANVLDAMGCTKQALLVNQTVHDMLVIYANTDQPSFSLMINSMVQEARLQMNLGNSNKALQVAEEALRFSRVNKLEPISSNLVWSLHGVALAALFCQNYKRASEVAREGCNISASREWRDIEGEHSILVRPRLFAALASAEANLGRRISAADNAQNAVDISLEIGGMKSRISATTAEWSYMETRGNLADILLATGDFAQARQICDERRIYFSRRVEKKIGDYRELAPILRMLGVLSCMEGRHEEGDTAAKELSRIMTMLENAYPSLLEQVKIRLRHQTKVPTLHILGDMVQRLDCVHQEVVSLFAT